MKTIHLTPAVPAQGPEPSSLQIHGEDQILLAYPTPQRASFPARLYGEAQG